MSFGMNATWKTEIQGEKKRRKKKLKKSNNRSISMLTKQALSKLPCCRGKSNRNRKEAMQLNCKILVEFRRKH